VLVWHPIAVRLFATCVIKNEIDIVQETLSAATQWCDVLYVHDTGSTDGTWEAVNDLASRFEQIVPYKREERLFHGDIRGDTFACYRLQAEEGDWWCPLDADEIYIDDPRIFLAEMDPVYGVVWSSCFEFMFTDKDHDRYSQDPSLYANDVPIGERIRYCANSWSESRFYRFRKDQIWQSRPTPCDRTYPRRIRYRHYQYRSPRQIQKRLDTRLPALRAGLHFRHERREHWAQYSRRAAELLAQGYTGPATWEERIVDSSSLHYDAHDGQFIADEAALPPIV
jgi:glycosyltransferase involved in cell wall biosynthesis